MLKSKIGSIECELKEGLTRKEAREYQEVLYKGAKSTSSGVIDQTSLLSNIEEQKDALMRLYVHTYGGKTMTQDIIDSMPLKDYESLLEKCQKQYKKDVEKKN